MMEGYPLQSTKLTMEKLINLIGSLKPAEIQLIEDFFAIRNNKTLKKNKKLQLFQFILNGKVKNKEDAFKFLFKKKCDSSLCRLKKILQKDILDVIMVSSFSSRQEANHDEEIECHKFLLQGKILLSRGLPDQGIPILKKVSQIAEKYEFPNIKLASDDILRTYVGLRSGFNSYVSYNRGIQKSFEVYEKILDAKENYLTVIPKLFNDDQSLENKCSKILQPEMLEKMEKGFNNSDSKKVKYWYYMMAIQFYLERKEYAKAKEPADLVDEIINTDPIKFSNREKSQVNIELAKICIHLKEYQKAVKFAEIATKYFNPNTLDFLNALHLLFFAYFRKGDYIQALNIVEEAQRHKHLCTIRIQPAVWSIFKAAVFFMQGEFRLSNNVILSQDKWPKERSLWLVGSKLLELVNILELRDYDWFEFKLESFRKLLSHFDLEQVKRCKIIYNLLRTLIKHCGNFNLAAFQENNHLLLLDQKGDLGWDPLGYEVVNISGWFSEKL